jgi:hypothetical protein
MPCVCGRPYDDHELPVSAPSKANTRETAASVARRLPAHAYANVRSAALQHWREPSLTVNEANWPWVNDTNHLPVNNANQERMDAAVRHRLPNARSHAQLSQAVQANHVPSSLSKEYNCAVWPFVVRQGLPQ